MKSNHRPKTDSELKRYLAEMREFTRETASSKTKALRFLVEAGIATPKGNLKAVYR